MSAKFAEIQAQHKKIITSKLTQGTSSDWKNHKHVAETNDHINKLPNDKYFNLWTNVIFKGIFSEHVILSEDNAKYGLILRLHKKRVKGREKKTQLFNSKTGCLLYLLPAFCCRFFDAKLSAYLAF